MKKLDDLISGLKDVQAEIGKVFEQVVRENEDLITEMVSESQLYEEGKRGDGVFIADFAPYRPMTIELKQALGQPTDRVTLRDEGDFHRSFYIEFKSDGFEIRASDWKEDKLKWEYGEEILKLSSEHLSDLIRNYVIPAIIAKFKAL